MSTGYFTCDRCQRVFADFSAPGEPEAEAAAAGFTAQEMTGLVSICDDCWHERRRAEPEFDARYGGRP